MRRRLITLAAGAIGAAGLFFFPSGADAGSGCPNPGGKHPPGQCDRDRDRGNGNKKPPGHNCPNGDPNHKHADHPHGGPPGQCKKAS